MSLLELAVKIREAEVKQRLVPVDDIDRRTELGFEINELKIEYYREVRRLSSG